MNENKLWRNRCGFLIVDPCFDTILYADRQFYQLLGLGASEEPRPFGAMIHPEDIGPARRTLQKQLATRDTAEVHFRVLPKTGGLAWHMLYAWKSTYQGRAVCCCTAFDMTPQRAYEKRLELLNGQLNTIIESTPGGVVSYALDTPNKVTFISDGMLKIIGCTRAQFFDRYEGDASRILHPEDKERVLEPMRRCKDPMQPQAYEYRIVTYEGRTKWLYGNRQVVRQTDGRLMVYFVVVDVNELHEAKARLAESDRLMQGVINSVPGGVARIAIEGERLHIVTANPAFYEMTGYTEAQWSEPPTCGDARHLIVKEDWPGLRDKIRHSLETRETMQHEYRVRTARGQTVWIMVKGSVVGVEHGWPIVQAFFINNTEEHLAMEALSRMNRTYQAMMDAVPGGVAQLVYDGHKVRCTLNDGYIKMLGYTREEYERDMSRTERGFVHPEDYDEVRRKTMEALRAVQPVRLEFRCLNKQGAVQWQLMHAVPVRQAEADGGVTVFQCIFMDITEQKQAQLALQYEKERYRTILNCSNDVIYEYDIASDSMLFYDKNHPDPAIARDGILIPHYLRWLEKAKQVHPEDRAKVADVFTGRQGSAVALRMIRPYGPERYYWAEMRGTVLYDEKGAPHTCLGTLHDIDQAKRETLRLKLQSERDSLTHLSNPAATRAAIGAYLENEGRDKTSALLLLDLDEFKLVNDMYGHQYGDRVLMDTAEKLRKVFRKDDVIGRIGGDEFVVFMKDVLETDIVLEKAQRICSAYAGTTPDGQELAVAGSVGVALYPRDGRTYQALFDRADRAMYAAKDQGRSRVSLGDREKRTADRAVAGLPLVQRAIHAFDGAATPREGLKEVLALVGRGFGADRVFCCWRADDEPFCLEQWTAHRVYDADVKRYEFDQALLSEYLSMFDERGLLCQHDTQDRALPAFWSGWSAGRGVKACLHAMKENGKNLCVLGVEEYGGKRVWSNAQAEQLRAVLSLVRMLALTE